MVTVEPCPKKYACILARTRTDNIFSSYRLRTHNTHTPSHTSTLMSSILIDFPLETFGDILILIKKSPSSLPLTASHWHSRRRVQTKPTHELTQNTRVRSIAQKRPSSITIIASEKLRCRRFRLRIPLEWRTCVWTCRSIEVKSPSRRSKA